MSSRRPIADRLQRQVAQRNRELAIDAIAKASLGVLFSLLTFACVFWFSWTIGRPVSGYVGLAPWQLALLVTGLYVVVAIWAAWHRANPLAGVGRMTNEERIVTLVSPVAPGALLVSPRHAVAGMAMILLGGPANIVSAISLWAHRIHADKQLLGEAALVLCLCEEGCLVPQLPNLAAALLLRRLALIKPVAGSDATRLELTDKGHRLIGSSRKAS
jgi:hypothetical protein